MATLTMQPIGPTPAPAAQEDQRKGENPPTVDGTDLSDIEPGARWVLGGVVYTVVPFYNRVRHLEGETVGFVENAVEVVEHIAEVTEKLAANVAKQLPEGGSLQKAVEEVEHIAVVVDDDAEKFEAVAEKIDKVSDEIDAAVEPVIEELEKELDQSTTSDDGVNTKN